MPRRNSGPINIVSPFRRNLTLAFLAALCCGALSPCLRAGGDKPTDRLENQEFWNLIEAFSEPGGYFRSDNLVSNERGFQQVIPDLVRGAMAGGVYLGVGPEQNFTYIAALKPKVAFIIDIRRGNLLLQLMYKALFELSADRADFVSRLFTRKRPENVGRTSTADQIFKAFHDAEAGSEAVYKQNLEAIDELLIRKHGFRLSKEDLSGIEYVYRKFYSFGPDITYSSSQARGPYGNVSYAGLMTKAEGLENRSYLSNEESYEVVKELEERNLIVPLVGDFAGPKTIRAVGKYLRERNATVSAFYISNVEHFIEDVWSDFCGNVASLPLSEKSTFIRSIGGSQGSRSSRGSILDEIKRCTAGP